VLYYEVAERRVSPNIMGVSWREYEKERLKRFSMVNRFKTPAGQPGPQNSEEQESKQIVHTFLSKRKRFPTKAQLRLFKDRG